MECGDDHDVEHKPIGETTRSEAEASAAVTISAFVRWRAIAADLAVLLRLLQQQLVARGQDRGGLGRIRGINQTAAAYGTAVLFGAALRSGTVHWLAAAWFEHLSRRRTIS